jgi:hypothetical protein
MLALQLPVQPPPSPPTAQQGSRQRLQRYRALAALLLPSWGLLANHSSQGARGTRFAFRQKQQ